MRHFIARTVGSWLVFVGLGLASPAWGLSIVVTSDEDSGPGSLRSAITVANSSNQLLPHIITFNIDDPSPIIVLRSPLPSISRSTIIRGTPRSGTASGPSPLILDSSEGPLFRLRAQVIIEHLNLATTEDHTLIEVASDNCTIRGCDLDGVFSSGAATSGIGIQMFITPFPSNEPCSSDSCRVANTLIDACYFTRLDLAISGITADNLTIKRCFFGFKPFYGANITSALPCSSGLLLQDCTEIQIGLSGQGNFFSNIHNRSVEVNGCTNASILANQIGINNVGTRQTIGTSTQEGVFLVNSKNVTLGTLTSGTGNVIGRQGGDAVRIRSGFLDSIEGNRIGVTSDGLTSMANNGSGIQFERDSSLELVRGNSITNNGKDGIVLKENSDGTRPTNVRMLENGIFSNGGLGINLKLLADDDSTVTSNDALDADSGPNNQLNFPRIISARDGGSSTLIFGDYSTAVAPSGGSTFRIDLFANFQEDLSGHGEGLSWVGSTQANVPSGASVGSWTMTIPGSYSGRFFTATASTGDGIGPGSTSEFSASVAPEQGVLRFASISPVVVTEGGAAVTVTVERLQSTFGPSIASFQLVPGTAVAADVTLSATSLNFADGESSKSFTITAVNDTSFEGVQSLTLTLASGMTNTTVDPAGDELTVQVQDNDPMPVINVSTPVAVTEGATQTFTVTLNAAASTEIRANYALGPPASGAAATSGQDYSATSGTLVFSPGQTSRTVNVTTTNDLADEDQEGYRFSLSSLVNASPGTVTAAALINDNDAQPILTVAAVTVPEGAGVARVAFLLDRPSERGAAVTYVTSNGTAAAPADFVAVPSTQHPFVAGETSFLLDVALVNDTGGESTETFTLAISVNALLSFTGTGIVVTITDDDGGLPRISLLNPAPVTEGGTQQFTVNLSNPAAGTVTVNFSTVSQTAKSPGDFTPLTGTVTFVPGDTTETVSIATLNDTTDEDQETYDVALNSPSGATLTSARATGAINDDDALPIITVSAVAVSEGSNHILTFSLDRATERAATLNWATVDGSALAPQDYDAVENAAITVPIGVTNFTRTISTNGDSVHEPGETYTVNFSTPALVTFPGGILGPLTLTILDNDLQPQIRVANAPAVGEGELQNFVVSFSNASTQSITVDYSSSDNSAIAPGDYTPVSGTLTFAPGETSQTIQVQTLQDGISESGQGYRMNLANATNATILDNQGTATINDNDPSPIVSLSGITSVVESVGSIVLTFTLDRLSERNASFQVLTSSGTARGGGIDFSGNPETITTTNGVLVYTLEIPIVDDFLHENQEDFNIIVTPFLGGLTISGSFPLAQIVDDDDPPEILVQEVHITETGNETRLARFFISLQPGSGLPVTVDVATEDGTARAGEDFTALVPQTLTFLPSSTFSVVDVTLTARPGLEPDEDFTLRLTNPTNATLPVDAVPCFIYDLQIRNLAGAPHTGMVFQAPAGSGSFSRVKMSKDLMNWLDGPILEIPGLNQITIPPVPLADPAQLFFRLEETR